MNVRTPADLGALVRERRRRLGLNQLTLANQLGVGREWLIRLERGEPGAALGTVLRALDLLDVALSVRPRASSPRGPPVPVADIDEIVRDARRKR